jgi:hypothetical protein
MVPLGYAEKTMASLLQLHSDLVQEKERRVDLYRRLMEREQVIAELRSYVRVLEARLALLEPKAQSASGPQPVKSVELPPVSLRSRVDAPVRSPPVPPQVGVRARHDGWKSW